MATSLARPVMRSPALRMASRRLESTAASSKAAEAARGTASKAQQGLSRVTSAAGPAIAGAARGVGNALGKIGGRTGRLVALVERQTPFVVYYSKVGAEVAKLVFQGQKMSPPSLATFQNTYQTLWRSLRRGTLFPSPQNMLQQARSLSTAQLAAAGVVAAECLGFFTVGEMLGRFKIVGYRGQTAPHH
ncbi:ATP synthase subunit g [Metarhizium album ARSEF 1941]|uniref:ATP synthase subunit g n=1 Tax=Metarhizium album (strain ARSEF 1941) TaxID=1081103 RepID=A0A0B2WV09_METAS|nr:ATP synthase subunit g [Metarhizium album ARSEF 1941]KHN96735.1 ATP synthase subunit g [Metarhizium album ARSEF 1941]